jgi:glycosyltransferase involved in cell wall biosynthesis
MKILFITPSYKPAFRYGGPSVSVSELAEALVSIGHLVTVYTTTANGKQELEVPVNKEVPVNGVSVYYHKRITGDHTHVSPSLWKMLGKTIRHFDMVHIHSWWSFLIIRAAWICASKKVPFILSPRGMLGAYSFTTHHSFSKNWIHRLVGKRILQKSYLHATTRLEWKDCMKVFSGWKGFILPNLVILPAEQKKGRKKNEPTLIMGFLGRIDPKKGLELLMEALAKLDFDFCLRIAGVGEAQYIKSLKTQARRLGISEKIEWYGWQQGKDKFQFLEELDLFVLTSYNENFALSVIESLAMGTAVLVSEGVGLADYVTERKLGWVCTTESGSIRETLEKINKNRNEFCRIKETAPNLIREDFDKKKLAHQYAEAYSGIVNENQRIIEPKKV